MTFDDLCEKFLGWNAGGDPPRRSVSTVRAYTSRLKPLRAELGDKPLADLKPLDIQEALDSANKGKAPDTQRLTITVCETLQRWGVKYQLLDAPILTGIEKPAGRKRERIPTPEETEAILEHGSPDFGRFYRALRQTGARPNELCRATVADWDRDRGLIVLKQHKTAKKTGIARKIAVGTKLEALILESLGDRTEGPLFVRGNGKPWTVNAFGSAFRRLRRKLKLPEDLVPYLARHEHATIVCREKGIDAAARALGHTNLQTTKRYAKDDDTALRENQDLV